jgi:hypothetical protein
MTIFQGSVVVIAADIDSHNLKAFGWRQPAS